MFRASQSWSTRCLTGLLVMALLLSLVPISASAVSSIGLSYSQPSVGRGSLKLYWDSAPNVEFYAYSVRDITTDESICSNERTSRTSASVSWTWENNHSYRIWAGACCTGNDPDNTSTWDYTGMDSYTVVGCPHTNTETAWDTTNHDVSYKSISDYEHKITGYEYEYCTKCFERIGKSHKVTETQAHVFDSDGDCTICNYRHSCQHKNTELVIASGFPSYKSCNDKEHTCTILYDRVCANATCGKVVKLGDTRTTEDQPHRFNSSGRCKDCGYQKSYEKLQVSVSRSQSEAYAGSSISASASVSGGDGQYKCGWEVTCNGQTVSQTDMGMGAYYSYTASTVGQYVFTVTVTDGQGSRVDASSQSITVKAKPCEHPTYAVQWTADPRSCKSISDSEHTTTGYQYKYCTVCGVQISEKFKATETEPHQFDAAGDCLSCDYRHSCQHKDTTLVIASGFPSYKSCNDKEHTCTILYDRVCANATCGKVVKLGDTRTTEDQPHRFNSSGRCKDCGYQKSYEKLQLGVSRLKAEAYVGDTIGASASASGGDGQYNYEWQISLNGQVIDTFAGGRDDSYTITASSAGQYVFTATVTDGQGSCKTASSSAITVKAKACEHTSYTDVPGTSKYTQISDAKHKKTTLMRRVCDSCKKTLNEYNKEVSESHHFSNGSCKECGAADPNAVCKHKNATNQFAYADITGQGNTQQHIVTDTYKVVCNDCGITIRTYETRRMADHNFNSDGVCSCGYAKPNTCDHANRKTTPLRVTGYVDKGSVGHEKTSLVRVECADCGIVLSAENTVTVVENHDFTYNNTCICGSQHVHDFNEGTRISGPTYSKLDDTQHSVTEVYRKTCKTCGYQTAETKTRQEKHSLTSKRISGPSYTNVNDNQHKVTEIYQKTCSICGYQTNETKTWNENHTFSEPTIDSIHDTAKDGHLSTAKCSVCGEELTLYGKLLGCEKCHPAASNRYSLYVSSDYYIDGMIYIGTNTPTTIMVYDSLEDKHMRASEVAGMALALESGYAIASLSGDVVVAQNSGVFSIKASYLGQKIESLKIGATLLSVKDTTFSYNISSSGAVRLEDLANIDWKNANVYITSNINISDFSTKMLPNGNLEVSFKAYNTANSVYGIAVYDANGNQVSMELIKAYWKPNSFYANAWEVLSNTSRQFDRKYSTQTQYQCTSINLEVPAGGHISVVSMGDDQYVFAANVAEAILGMISNANEIKDVVVPNDINALIADVKSFPKDKLYKLIEDSLLETYGEHYYEAITSDTTLAESILKSLFEDSSTSDKLLLLVLKESMKSTISSAGNVAEDVALGLISPAFVRLKKAIFSIGYDAQLLHLRNEMDAALNGTGKIVNTIIVPNRTNIENTFNPSAH